LKRQDRGVSRANSNADRIARSAKAKKLTARL
jgi:hypothetical protein